LKKKRFISGSKLFSGLKAPQLDLFSDLIGISSGGKIPLINAYTVKRKSRISKLMAKIYRDISIEKISNFIAYNF
jgi:hypothetical protein